MSPVGPRDNLFTTILGADCCGQIYALGGHMFKKARPGEREQPHAGGVEMKRNLHASSQVDDCPLVSIGMAIFNCEKTLATAIRSILNQTCGNWELLLMEDGSSDRTLEVARTFS